MPMISESGVASERLAVPSALSLAVAGSASVATAFGMARYGYGLLLPDIQHDLALSTAMLGAIGTLSYVTYVVATGLVGSFVAYVGARTTVVVGGVFAVCGTILVAQARDAVVLGLGVAIAGASAGLVYPPFADVLEQLPEPVRARTQATINCGTGWGVAVAAPIAIVAGDAWRNAYLGFAACAALSTLYAARTLPSRQMHRAATRVRCTRGIRPAAVPVFAAALLIGLGSAAFWTFAVDQAHTAGLNQTAGRALLGMAGVTSILGIGAADLIRRFGAGRTFVLAALIEGAAIATVGLTPDKVVPVLLAGAAFGATYSTIVTVTVFWATLIYFDRPSAGVATVAGGNAIGLLAGPLTGGIVAETIGLRAALLAGAAIILSAALLKPQGDVIRDH